MIFATGTQQMSKKKRGYFYSRPAPIMTTSRIEAQGLLRLWGRAHWTGPYWSWSPWSRPTPTVRPPPWGCSPDPASAPDTAWRAIAARSSYKPDGSSLGLRPLELPQAEGYIWPYPSSRPNTDRIQADTIAYLSSSCLPVPLCGDTCYPSGLHWFLHTSGKPSSLPWRPVPLVSRLSLQELLSSYHSTNRNIDWVMWEKKKKKFPPLFAKSVSSEQWEVMPSQSGNSVLPIPGNRWENCHLSLVPCHLSIVNCHFSIVTCHFSLVYCYLSIVPYPLSFVTCYLSLVTYQSSLVACHFSLVTCHL